MTVQETLDAIVKRDKKVLDAIQIGLAEHFDDGHVPDTILGATFLNAVNTLNGIHPLDGGSDKVVEFPSNSDWRKVVIHFGKKKGVALGDLGRNLEWWQQNYKPTPYKGKINPPDKALRAALDASMGTSPELNRVLNSSVEGGDLEQEPDDINF